MRKTWNRRVAALGCAALLGGCNVEVPSDAGSGGTTGAGSGAAGNAGTGAGGVGTAGTTGGTGVAGTGIAGTGIAGMGAGTGTTAGTSAAGSGGDGGTGAGGGDGGMGGDGCEGTSLLPVPEDPTLRGPWHVGVRTVTIGRLTAEIVYPATPASTAGMPEATYDIRDWLPTQEQAKVPDANSPAVGPIGGNLYRDAPIDAEHGPYPVVIFIHGTASFRIASGSINTHWASRGFVVIMADYPGLGLTDQLNVACGYPTTGAQMIPEDVNAQIAALKSATGDLAFLSGHVDMTRLGISGHSQGGCMSSALSTLENVQIVIPMSGSSGTLMGPALESIMYISGIDDTVIGYEFGAIGSIVCPPNPLPATTVIAGYDASPGPPDVVKRLVGITGGGHLLPTDLCQKNAQGRNAIEEANMDGVCGINNAVIIGLPALFDCGTLDRVEGNEVVIHATTAALEETLHCKDRDAVFATLQADAPAIGDFKHMP